MKRFRLICLSLILLSASALAGDIRDASGLRPAAANPLPSALIELDGTGSEHPDGGALEYHWTQVDGSRVRLSDPTSAKPTFRTGEPGLYRFELVVTADGMSSEPFIVEIMIERDNLPPVAVAPEEVWGEVGKPIELDGGASYDPEEETITYRWRSLTSGLDLPRLGINQPTLTFTPDTDGVFEVELLVSDGENVSQAAITRVFVKPKPRPPVARARAVPKEIPNAPVPEQAMTGPRAPQPIAKIEAPAQVRVGEAVLLDARASRGFTGNKLDYLWRQKSGPFVTKFETALAGAGGSFMPPRPGDYAFELIVTDGVAESEPVSHLVRVIGDAQPPVAVVTAPERVQPGTVVRMDATASYDPEGLGLTYRWRQTGGPRVTDYLIDDRLGDAAPGFRPDNPGAYSFELVVSNGRSQSKPIEIDIMVDSAPAAQTPPLALGITGPGVANVGERITLGAATSGSAGPGLEFAWRQVEGPAPAVTQTSGQTVDVRPTLAGRYIFDVSALENGSVVASARQVVEVFDGRVGLSPTTAIPPPLLDEPLRFTSQPVSPPLASLPVETTAPAQPLTPPVATRPSASASATRLPSAVPGQPIPAAPALNRPATMPAAPAAMMPTVPATPPPLPSAVGSRPAMRAAAQIHPSILDREASALDPLTPLLPMP